MHKLYTPISESRKRKIIKELKKKNPPQAYPQRIRNIQKKKLKTVKICYPTSRWITNTEKEKNEKIPGEQTSHCTHEITSDIKDHFWKESTFRIYIYRCKKCQKQ